MTQKTIVIKPETDNIFVVSNSVKKKKLYREINIGAVTYTSNPQNKR